MDDLDDMDDDGIDADIDEIYKFRHAIIFLIFGWPFFIAGTIAAIVIPFIDSGAFILFRVAVFVLGIFALPLAIATGISLFKRSIYHYRKHVEQKKHQRSEHID